MVVIPAGVGPGTKVRRVDSRSSGPTYADRIYDLRTGEEGERPEVLKNIRNVSLPESDPLFGEKGPLTQRC